MRGIRSKPALLCLKNWAHSHKAPLSLRSGYAKADTRQPTVSQEVYEWAATRLERAAYCLHKSTIRTITHAATPKNCCIKVPFGTRAYAHRALSFCAV